MVEGGLLLAVFRFIVQDGGIIKLGEGDLEVACMKASMGEDVEKSQADSHVDKIMNAVTWIGGCILEISSPTCLEIVLLLHVYCTACDLRKLRGHS